MSNDSSRRDASPTREDFESLVKKANGGNKAALVELRRVLDDNPHIWRAVGNLGLHARMALARSVAGGDELVYDSLMRYAYELETELLGPSPTPLERLVVQRIVACWLEANHAALKGSELAGTNGREAKHALQARESAERRLNAAIKSYTLVKKLRTAEGKGRVQSRAKPSRKRSPSPTKAMPMSNGDGSFAPINRLAGYGLPWDDDSRSSEATRDADELAATAAGDSPDS